MPTKFEKRTLHDHDRSTTSEVRRTLSYIYMLTQGPKRQGGC